METSEATIDTTSRLTVMNSNNASEVFYPQELWTNMYHTSSTFNDTGNTFYNFQVRDSFGNLGGTQDSVYYQIISPYTNSEFNWPNKIEYDINGRVALAFFLMHQFLLGCRHFQVHVLIDLSYQSNLMLL